MGQMLHARETAISYFKQVETVAVFVCKLLLGLFLFSLINHIGYPAEQLQVLTTAPYRLMMLLVLAILFAACPVTVGYGLMVLAIAIHISGDIGVLVFVTAFLLCVMFFYVRLAPKESVLIIAVCCAYYFKMPYVVPLVAGLYCHLSAIIPIVIGVFVWHFAPMVTALLTQSADVTVALLEMPKAFDATYVAMIETVKTNETWVMSAFIFAMVTIVVFVIARLGINYAKEIAVGIGAATTMVCFIVAVLVTGADINILGMMFMCVVSAGVAFVVCFFDVVLDYQSVERVQFEDEDNVYMVKVIPKMLTPRRKRQQRRAPPPEE